MIEGRSILAVIPARGTSRGLPGKNTLLAGGKPVIAWSIEAAQASRYVDRVILSSEDEEIMEMARQWNCEVPFARPPELATDAARIEDALLHALDTIVETYDYLVLLQPTSPLRSAEDIDRCLEICQRTGAPACVSVSEPRRSPYWMYRVEDDGRMEPLFDDGPEIHRRQDLPTIQSPQRRRLRRRDELVPPSRIVLWARDARPRNAFRARHRSRWADRPSSVAHPSHRPGGMTP